MDSKYASVGRERDTKNSYDIKVKRIKLNIDNSNLVTKDNETVNGKISNGVDQINKASNFTSKENNDVVQEERKALPVYMVRGR